MLSLDGDRQAKPLLRTEFNEAQASISPDGRWLSYTSDESGHPEVYVQRFRSAGGGGESRRAEARCDGGPTAASCSTLPATED
jgi:Tol biopolymer transport system component